MNATILIVDDEPKDCKLLELLLRPEGYRTVSVGSGEGAMAEVARHAPDLILLDVMMPGMDGVDTLRALREIPETVSTPVIFLTARVQPADVAKYKELDSLAVIRKPFEPTALVETIHEIWTRHRGEVH